MLDINEFRVEKGGNPDKIRESQRRRCAKVELVDEVIDLDREWLKCKGFQKMPLFPIIILMWVELAHLSRFIEID